ncbi:unnamed protein product [Kluyveromyces dobzhanskii CBS 2104]|uniref:WGS project CCBQ000000000 data, contig 00017 n=1 Tax=Kluyveromyces dobzhanskii CBS 2104 TaxID=1427455 RepID=A0A0A8L8V5_9SACH|nr:unnamed protein product [Kluyveromyces dobzhanskii CBS 2104]
MGSAYKILGKTVQPHVLAIATLVSVFGASAYAMSGPKQAKPAATPAAPAAGGADELDVEKLLGDFLKEESK